jgi:hypothetical protein
VSDSSEEFSAPCFRSPIECPRGLPRTTPRTGQNFAPIEPLRPPEGVPDALRRIDLGEHANNPVHLITADEQFRIATALHKGRNR